MIFFKNNHLTSDAVPDRYLKLCDAMCYFCISNLTRSCQFRLYSSIFKVMEEFKKYDKLLFSALNVKSTEGFFLFNIVQYVYTFPCLKTPTNSHEKRVHYAENVPAGSPSRGGGVTVYVYDINQPSLPTPFNSVLVSVSVFMALSTVFHSINSPDNSPFSHSVLPVLSLPYWSFQLYVSS